MLRLRTSVASLGLCFGLAACGAPAADPAASQTSGSEVAALPPPPPPPPEAEQAPPAHVPVTVTNTPEAAKVVPVADPVAVSGDVYKVVLDSPRMRILEATWKPGQKDEPHGHPPLVAYALTDMKGIGHGDDGTDVAFEVRAGQAFFQNAMHSHAFENTGKKVARALIVELKQGVDPEPMPNNHFADCTKASPDVYRKVFEDQHVRVVYASWEPGKMDDMHAHPGLAAYFLTDIKAKLHGSLGETEDIESAAGQALFHAPVAGHMFENVGDKPARMILFEPKSAAFGAAVSGKTVAGASASGGASDAELPLEEGDGEVTSFIDSKRGVILDIGGGFTAEVPVGGRFTSVVTFSTTTDRPSNSVVAPGFSRHAATLVFDGYAKSLAKPMLFGIGIRRMPVKTGQRFVLAMETSGECTKANKRYELDDGGCSEWVIFPTEFDEARGKVVAKVSNPAGYRLQFGWLPE